MLDLDGPLLNGVNRHYQCYSDILVERGFGTIPLQQYWEMKRNRTNRKIVLSLSGASEIYDEFLSAWMERIETRPYLMLDRLQDHVVDILDNWKSAGVRLLLATMRNNAANLFWQLREFGIDHFLDEVVVVGSSQLGANKSTEIRPLLKQNNLKEVIWIGDTEVDVFAARELGIKVCALTCGLRTQEYLASLSPDMLEPDLISFSKNRFGSL